MSRGGCSLRAPVHHAVARVPYRVVARWPWAAIPDGKARSKRLTMGELTSYSVPMLTGEVRNQVDQIWNAFWSGGISNPLEVIEQITYLLFLRRLDELPTLEESKAARLEKPIERRVFPWARIRRDGRTRTFVGRGSSTSSRRRCTRSSRSMSSPSSGRRAGTDRRRRGYPPKQVTFSIAQQPSPR
jgi:hypothetical protein